MNPDNPHDWFLKAERDFGLAFHTHKQELAYPDLICHHCQQAAEKFLKALIIYHKLPLKKTYNLKDLLDSLKMVEPSIDTRFYVEAFRMRNYAVDVRYPDPSGDPSEADVEEALTTAAFFRTFAAGVLGV